MDVSKEKEAWKQKKSKKGGDDMRLIDADAFRRELDNHWPFTKEEQSKHGIADLAKSEVLIVLNQMPTIEERKWIPCSDCERKCEKWENSKT
ncbi:MAG: hypothetical protein IIZ94_12980 [Prevotella sp.]|nr:hypothetical protein [Prevotella sp.]